MPSISFYFISISQNLFSLQINDIQNIQLTPAEYEKYALQPEYRTRKTIEQPISLDKKQTLVDDDGTTFEIFVISEDFEAKPTIDNEIEEFELLEVDHSDANIDNVEAKEINDDSMTKQNDAIDSMEIVETEKDETVKIVQIRSRCKQKVNLENIRKSARQIAKTQKEVQNHPVLKNNSISKKTRKADNLSGNTDVDESFEVEEMQEDSDVKAEGESDDEFPARDSDNEDWPSQETLNDFPKTIIKDGLLLVKGKELMSMISRYKLPFFSSFYDLFWHGIVFIADFTIWNAKNVKRNQNSSEYEMFLHEI